MNKFLKVLSCAAVILAFQSNWAFAEGAIAVNDSAGTKASDAGYGYGAGDTKASAEADALKKCKEAGNDTCKVVLSYTKCGAYAGSYDYFGTGVGDTEDAAKAKALESCGNDKCKVIASNCE